MNRLYKNRPSVLSPTIDKIMVADPDSLSSRGGRIWPDSKNLLDPPDSNLT
jgi:hypothetical protein